MSQKRLIIAIVIDDSVVKPGGTGGRRLVGQNGWRGIARRHCVHWQTITVVPPIWWTRATMRGQVMTLSHMPSVCVLFQSLLFCSSVLKPNLYFKNISSINPFFNILWIDEIPEQLSYPVPCRDSTVPLHVGQVLESYCKRFSKFRVVWQLW